MESVEKMLSGILDPKQIIESILPITITVKLKIYKAKDGSYVLQILPIEEIKNE